MEEMIPCAVENQEVFQRVWQRVMAGREGGDCPLECVPANMQGDLSCACLEALARQEAGGIPPECERQDKDPACAGCVGNTEAPPEAPAEPSEIPSEPEQDQPAPERPGSGTAEGDRLPSADGPDRENDLPRLWEEPQEASDRTARLRHLVMELLEGWQFYRHLAKRARGNDARTLNSMAGELHRHARKVSAAYFLLTGLRYWPIELLSAPAISSYWGALRTRHQTEQRQETALRTAADDWEDPDLLELHQELMEGCRQRCRQLRTLLEQGTP